MTFGTTYVLVPLSGGLPSDFPCSSNIILVMLQSDTLSKDFRCRFVPSYDDAYKM